MENANTKTFLHSGVDCELVVSEYQEGGIAVRAVVADTYRNQKNGEYPGTPYGTLSINVGKTYDDPKSFVFKTYSENSGLFEACLDAGLIEDTGLVEELSFNTVPVVRLVV